MTKNNATNQIKQSRLWVVRLNPEQVSYLCVPTKFGASRLKAYLSLLKSAAETTSVYKPLYGRTINLEEGQLVISITEMSEQWIWARETVRKFFDQLEAFGLLTKEQLDRCSLITMTMEWVDAGYKPVFQLHSPPFVLPEQLSVKMDEWLDGYIADEELIESIGETGAGFESTDPGVLSNQIVSLQYALIRQLIGKWAIPATMPSDILDDTSRQLLSELFDTALFGNWKLWLVLLKEKAYGIAETSTTSTDAESLSAGRVILDKLLRHLNVDFVKNDD